MVDCQALVAPSLNEDIRLSFMIRVPKKWGVFVLRPVNLGVCFRSDTQYVNSQDLACNTVQHDASVPATQCNMTKEISLCYPVQHSASVLKLMQQYEGKLVCATQYNTAYMSLQLTRAT